MLDQNKKYKIALIGDCLSLGGAEKVMALLSIYFDKQGFEVHNCIFVDIVSYDYSGSLFNLGTIKPNSNPVIRRTVRFFEFKKFIKQHDFDFLIDFRMRQNFFLEFLLSRVVYPKNAIFYVLSGIIDFYFPKSKFLARLVYSNKKIATVSAAIESEISARNYSNKVHNLFQPFDFESIKRLESETKIDDTYILAVGNMNTDNKQIDKLILAYSKSELPSKKVKLFVLGDGLLKTNYTKLVEQLGLENFVFFKGIFKNPFPYYKNAKFYVLSSKNEGLSNAIIESLVCETPVVAFDCFSGPSEIITSHENGILVGNQNFEKLTEAMNLMATDKKLLQHCKANAAKSVEKFSIEIIGQQWLDYLAKIA